MKKAKGLKAEDLKTKTADELKDMLLDLKKEQLNLRLQMSQGQLENTARVRTIRRDIARVMAVAGNGASEKTPAAAKKKETKPKGKKAAA